MIDDADSRKTLHDVNAALQVVIGNLELLNLSADDEAERQRMIDGALDGAVDAARLVRALQDRLRATAP